MPCHAKKSISLCPRKSEATGIADPEAVCEARPAMIVSECK